MYCGTIFTTLVTRCKVVYFVVVVVFERRAHLPTQVAGNDHTFVVVGHTGGRGDRFFVVHEYVGQGPKREIGGQGVGGALIQFTILTCRANAIGARGRFGVLRYGVVGGLVMEPLRGYKVRDGGEGRSIFNGPTYGNSNVLLNGTRVGGTL